MTTCLHRLKGDCLSLAADVRQHAAEEYDPDPEEYGTGGDQLDRERRFLPLIENPGIIEDG